VLDEADRMLDMGFAEDIAAIAQHCPPPRARRCCSRPPTPRAWRSWRRATCASREVKLAERHAASQIRERFYEVAEAKRLHAVGLLLNHFRPESTLAFCNTKQQCRDLVAVLQAQGIVALELHGDLEQRERDQVLVQFANRSCSVLVATDVAARGLDIAGLEAVINVDITPDAEVHTHRIGRTGRAGESGLVFSLASLDEMGRVGRIEAAGPRERVAPAVGAEADSRRRAAAPADGDAADPGGRKEKIRAGDVLGALTKDIGLPAAPSARSTSTTSPPTWPCSATWPTKALRGLNAGKVKGAR
jgi:ATP-dependent RNA helicase DbpA